MSDILSRYPVVFEDEETKQVLPHYDKASNQYYNNRNTHMASDNLQDAIDELHGKIGQSGQQTYTNCNVIKLEDCEGYEDRFALDEIPTYNYSNPQTGTAYNKTQFDADEDNADLLQLAQDTSAFIQSVIDTLQESDVLLFPEGKVFLIGWGDKSYLWGQLDLPLTPVEYEAYSNKAIPQWYGLQIRHPAHIDLNGSTLKASPCWYPHYIMIMIGRWRYAYSVDTDPISPAGSIIKNGTLIGAKYEISRVISTGSSWEHYKCINATSKVTFADLTIRNSIGDAISVESRNDYANNPEITFSNNKYLNSSGKAVAANDGNSNTWCSDYYAISAFRYNYYNYRLILRPYLGVNQDSYTDMASKFVDERYIICYYTGTTESSFIKYEYLRYGDMLNIPSNATHFRVSVDVDSDYYVNSGNIDFRLICITVDPAYGTLIDNCDISDCGRDGLTLASIYNGVIKNCRIRNCKVSIDIESYAYADKAMLIDGLIADYVSSTTPNDILIKNSTITDLKTGCPYYIIDNCDINQLILSAPNNKDSHFNISMPKRIVTNSIIRSTIYAINTIFDNCVITANFPITGGYTYHTWGFHPNIFKYCAIKSNKILPGRYYDCSFLPRFIDANNSRNKVDRNLELQIYAISRIEENPYIFERCDFNVYSISSFDNYVTRVGFRSGVLLEARYCSFLIEGYRGNQGDSVALDGRGTNFGHCYVKDFSNNYVKLTVLSGPVYNNNSTSFPITFNLYSNARINNNLFEPLNNNGASRFIKIALNNIIANNVHNVSIQNNIVHHNLNTSINVGAGASLNQNPPESIFLYIQAKSENDDIVFNINDNTFALLPPIVTEVTDLPIPGNSNVYYHLKKYPYHYYKWVAVSFSDFSIDGEENIIYYNTVKRKFYYWSDSASVDEEKNKYREFDNYEDGYDLIEDYVLDVSTLPSTDIDTNAIYHNTTTDKYYRYLDNAFVQIDSQMGIKDVVLSLSGANAVDTTVANVPKLEVNVASKCIISQLDVPEDEDSRIHRTITTNN